MQYPMSLVIAICYRTSIIDRLSVLFDMDGNFSLVNYQSYLGSGKYLIMTLNSVWYAF